MAEKADEIVQRWQQYVPPRVPKEEVDKVVQAYFPMSHKVNFKNGSHQLLIDDEELRWAEKGGINTGTRGGFLSLPLVGGKEVKEYYVKNLLDAIAVKEEIRQLREEQVKSKAEKKR